VCCPGTQPRIGPDLGLTRSGPDVLPEVESDPSATVYAERFYPWVST
jgi:hypothetical protein